MTSNKPTTIGLAGGIGAGKSAVAEVLRELGCVVCNSDELGRAALRDSEIRTTLVEWWGEGILNDDGEIDRRAVARIVFRDPEQRRRLEELSHPWIEARRLEQFAAAPVDATALVIDAPLLFEAGLDSECDAVIYVDAPREQRLQRVQMNRGWDESELDRRESWQTPLDEKRRKSDFVILNDQDLVVLRDRVRAVLEQIVESSCMQQEKT